jgi:drug/metabolite transporter (DMT)-like permease
MFTNVMERRGLLWPLAMLVTAGVGTGLMFSLNRIATVDGVPFIPYVFWSCLLSGIVLLGLSVARRTPPSLSWPHLRTYIIVGVLGMALPITILAFVAPKVPASVLALGQTLVPMMTYLLALALVMERFHWFGIGGIVLGLVGVLLIIVPEASLPEPEMAGWVAVALLAPLCFAVCGISAAKFRPPEARSVSVSAGVQLVAALFLLPVMAVADSWWFFASDFGEGEAALIVVALFYVVFWLCFFEIIRLAGPVFFSTSNYIATVAGVVWGLIIFGDSLSPWIWGALVLMIAGLYLMNVRGKPAAAS